MKSSLHSMSSIGATIGKPVASIGSPYRIGEPRSDLGAPAIPQRQHKQTSPQGAASDLTGAGSHREANGFDATGLALSSEHGEGARDSLPFLKSVSLAQAPAGAGQGRSTPETVAKNTMNYELFVQLLAMRFNGNIPASDEHNVA